jgi:hypothetical protein
MNLNFTEMNRIVYISICLMFIWSCNFIDREIDIELPDHRSRIVLNSIAKDGDEEIRLRITRSLGMKDTGSISEPLKNVNITYTVNDFPVNGFRLDSLGDYVAKHPIKSGDKLEIAVSAEGYESISSRTIVPKAAELVFVRFGGVQYGFDNEPEREVIFQMKDIPNENNFYQIGFTQMSEDNSRVWSVQLRSLVPWFAPIYPMNLAFDDTSFKDGVLDGQALINENAFLRHNVDRESYFILETIDQEHYNYITTFYYHRLAQSPDLFTGEAVPMPTNVQGGFGIFSSAAKTIVKMD